MSKNNPRRNRKGKRAYLKQIPSGQKPVKEVLQEYADRVQSYTKEMPISQITGKDLDYWQNIPPRVPDNCPPRIRVLLKLREQDSLFNVGFYFITLLNGRYRTLNLFHGSRYFFIEETQGIIRRSCNYDTRDGAMTAFRYGQIEGWHTVHREVA